MQNDPINVQTKYRLLAILIDLFLKAASVPRKTPTVTIRQNRGLC
jgi:hypothetical protein